MVRKALTKRDSTMPTRMMVWFSIFRSSRAENPIARNTVASPHTDAIRGRVNRFPRRGRVKPDTITAAAPSDAPEDTPRV